MVHLFIYAFMQQLRGELWNKDEVEEEMETILSNHSLANQFIEYN
jgi:hypothetical protein